MIRMKIAKETLLFILEVSKSCAPMEFAGLLQAEGDVITEVVIVPGTNSSEAGALMHLYILPNIPTIGTVHSHPASNLNPSKADLELFGKRGSYHIIVGAPYDIYSWACYNKKGARVKLEVVDYEFKE